MSPHAAAEVPLTERFGFGRNWQGFLDHAFTRERVEIARRCLLDFLEMEDLNKLDFVDVGCGSGLHSLAAWQAGAQTVVSFDFDPHSVAATRRLHQLAGAPENWSVYQGSVLDREFCLGLGRFDVVYAWGSLHHTGDQWRALANAAALLGERGRLFVALYTADATLDPSPDQWLEIKQSYNKAGWLRRRMMEAWLVFRNYCHGRWINVLRLPSIARRYRQSRGMDMMTDVRDWLGGWPMQFSTAAQIYAHAEELGLAVAKVSTAEINYEYLLVPRVAMQALGLTELPAGWTGIPIMTGLDALPPDMPVYIWGNGVGAEVLVRAMERFGLEERLAGFVDLRGGGVFHQRAVAGIEQLAVGERDRVVILLPNRYLSENGGRLLDAGFRHILNARPWINQHSHEYPP